MCIGFQKCGTTSLYDILRQHKKIYLTEGVKEPMFTEFRCFGPALAKNGMKSDILDVSARKADRRRERSMPVCPFGDAQTRSAGFSERDPSHFSHARSGGPVLFGI